jgi:hypothetical protein
MIRIGWRTVRVIDRRALQPPAGLGEEDVVEGGGVDLQVLDRDPLAVERADHVGELGAALVETHGRVAAVGPLWGSEPGQHGPHRLLGALLERRRLDRRPTDLVLERLGCALGDDLADVDDPDPVGERVRLLEVLGGQEHRHALVVGEARDLIPERRAALHVEAGRGLVEKQDARGVDERQREVEPPPHPARVAANLALRGIREADALDQLVTAARRLRLRDPVHPGLQAHVLTRRQKWIEGRLLERDADRVADRRPLSDDVVAGDGRRPRGRGEQRGEHVNGGRLAGAVRPQEAVDLTRGDGEVDPVDRPRALAELANEAVRLDPVACPVRLHTALASVAPLGLGPGNR